MFTEKQIRSTIQTTLPSCPSSFHFMNKESNNILKINNGSNEKITVQNGMYNKNMLHVIIIFRNITVMVIYIFLVQKNDLITSDKESEHSDSLHDVPIIIQGK